MYTKVFCLLIRYQKTKSIKVFAQTDTNNSGHWECAYFIIS